MGYRHAIFIALLLALQSPTPAGLDSLRNGFLNPPDTARPGVYWFFMDGNVSREGITADLEAMKSAGVGGVILMEVSVGIPRGPVEFMSLEWRQLFKHAVEEAERLGLEITLNAGPGWTGSGGPWVKVEQSMQHLVVSEVAATGPSGFDAILPVPEPLAPYFGENNLTSEMMQARERFYDDVALLAIPRIEGGRIEDIQEKALYLREPYTSKPGVKPFLPAPASHPKAPSSEILPAADILDLTHLLQPDGRLVWEVPEGEWTLLRFGRRTTGANTRPAPEPGVGFESDKFDRAALDAHFEAFIGELIRTVGPRPDDRSTGWTMLHIDSWEMGSQNWTKAFDEEFERRRGYDLLPYLPTLTGRVVESRETSERFLWDLRLTAQELVLENHVAHLKGLGRRHGFGLSIEPYDMNPTSDLTLGGMADVPMCEFWSEGYGFNSNFTCFEAVSAAHTQGRPIVAAEAFTADSKEAWRLFPGAMKNQGDWAFGVGINRLVFHRFAHQPWLDRKPGMTMGPYGVHWDRTQTFWPMVGAYHRYLARCQHLLRQGTPVADVCYLIPEGAPHVFRPPPSALEGTPPDRRGYSFDGCSPETLIAHARVEDGRILFPGGVAYRILVLPSFDTMTPALLRKIRDLVESGAVVVGSPPLKSPSLSGYPLCDEEVRTLSLQLWGDLTPPKPVVERKVGLGGIVWGGDLIVSTTDADEPATTGPESRSLYPNYEATARLLEEKGIPPDFESTGPIRYVHRMVDGADLYFVSNRTADVVDAACAFRVVGRTPELWDPVEGVTYKIGSHWRKDGQTIIPLRFEKHQSFFIVFHGDDDVQAEKNRVLPNSRIEKKLLALKGPWETSFDPAFGGPGTTTFGKLEDWRIRKEEGIKYYSGIAVYRNTFDRPVTDQRGGGTLYLDLGEVHNMARVRLNGHDLGVVWCAPWRVDIMKAVQERENQLEIEVANLWPNRLIGDERTPAENRISWTTWSPYKSDSPLLPSGLLGPVTVVEGP